MSEAPTLLCRCLGVLLAVGGKVRLFFLGGGVGCKLQMHQMQVQFASHVKDVCQSNIFDFLSVVATLVGVHRGLGRETFFLLVVLLVYLNRDVDLRCPKQMKK